jgi:heat shock protein HslJ
MMKASTAAVFVVLLHACGGGDVEPEVAQEDSSAPAAPPAERHVSESSTRFRASGNEPSWVLVIDGDRLTLITAFGERQYVADTPAPEHSEGSTRYATRIDERDFRATIFDRLCRDTMTGMPHPHSVEVVLGEETFSGCGGDPAALLEGGEWAVFDMAGTTLADESHVTLEFGPEGRLHGRAPCNTFSAAYALSGEGLSVTAAATTRMACPEPLMAQEALFLSLLETVGSFDIDPAGALVLRSHDGRTITARR